MRAVKTTRRPPHSPLGDLDLRREKLEQIASNCESALAYLVDWTPRQFGDAALRDELTPLLPHPLARA